MSEMLGSGKCNCLNTNEKIHLRITIIKTIQSYEKDIREEKDQELIQSYKDEIKKLNNLKEKLNNTPACET